MIAGSLPEADAVATLQQQFLDHTSAATEQDLAEAEASANGTGFMTNTLVTRGVASTGRPKAATALPGGYADEMDRVAALRVATAEAGPGM